VNTVQPAYAQLIESFGGEDSPEWATEAARLVAEHESAKAGAAKQIALSGGDIARIMSNQKTQWTQDMRWLATMDIHAMFLMVSGNAASPAAHAQNECRLGSEEMAAWYNSNFNMSTQLASIYRFILGRRSEYADLDQYNEQERKRKRDEELSTTYKTRTAVKDTLIALFAPYVKVSKFPWTNLAKVLVNNKLVISNFVPDHEFPNFGSSHSDDHTTDQYKALYYALEETHSEKRITVTKLDDWPAGGAEDVALITDRCGEVILSLAAARDGAAGPSAEEIGGDGSSGGNGGKRTATGAGLDDGRGKKRGTRVPVSRSGGGAVRKQKRAPKSAPVITDDSDNLDVSPSLPGRAPSENSIISSLNPSAQPPQSNTPQMPISQPRPKPRFSSSLPLTSAPSPTSVHGNGASHWGSAGDWVNFGTEQELNALAGQLHLPDLGGSLGVNFNTQQMPTVYSNPGPFAEPSTSSTGVSPSPGDLFQWASFVG
jgi:hypothetical protein